MSLSKHGEQKLTKHCEMLYSVRLAQFTSNHMTMPFSDSKINFRLLSTISEYLIGHLTT